ncbi:MAG: T9SS type A sorting domain-containing protein [Flavobacteriales bacterium]|nr:T9SS type A sorting domain-containing protein [Flavobacteriales bacterium]
MKKLLLSLAVLFSASQLFSQSIENQAPRKVHFDGTKKTFGVVGANQDKGLEQMWVDYSVASFDDFLTAWPFNSDYVLADTIGPGINNLFSKAAVGITGQLAGYIDYIDLEEKFTSLNPSFTSVIDNVYPSGYELKIDTFYVGFTHQNQTGLWNYLEPTIVTLGGGGTGAPTNTVLWSTRDSVNQSQTTDLNSIGLFQWPVNITIPANQRAGLVFKYFAPKQDSLFIAGSGLDSDDNQVIENPSAYQTSWMGLVYLSNGAYIRNTNVGFGNPVGSAGWFFAQNWWIWANVTYVDNSSINEQDAFGFKIEPLYPNPFAQLANIRYTIEKESEITFELTDVTGKVVYNERIGNQFPGTYTYQLQRDNLNSGVYFYSFIVNGNKVTKRMIVE